MLQTETLLLILLGFALAAFIFLFVGRLLWATAIRVGARRMQRQVPSTVADLQSERDRLRAEYARISQKLGARLESLRMEMAEHMSEVTRNRNRIETLVQDLNARDDMLAARDREIEESRRQLGLAENEAASLRQHLQAVEAELARRDAEAAAPAVLPAPKPVEPLLALPEPSPPTPLPAAGEAATSDERLKRRIEKLTALSQQMAETRSADPAPADPPLIDRLAEAARETEDLQKELARLDEAWRSAADAGPADGQPPEAAAGEPPRAIANVVSLANRLRSLQKDFVK